MKWLVLLVLFSFFSCANYVQSVHRQIDNEQRQQQRMRYRSDRRPIQNPVTLGGPTANTKKNLYPSVKRNYNTTAKRRYQASDLVDNQSDGSLWSGKNSETFLFVNNNLKRKGDIVIIEVKKQLKDKIQDELKRAFPEPKKRGAKAAEEPAGEEEAQTAANAPAENPDKVYDKISTTVMEQMNQDYLLIRGRKEVMYKKFKRYFEIQAIVSQRDITSTDAVSSTKLLEPKINVLRY